MERIPQGRRSLLKTAGFLVLIAVIGVGWYLGSPLFIDETVDEAFPFEVPDADFIAALPESERGNLENEFMTAMPDNETIQTLSPEDQDEVGDAVMEAAAVVMMDKPVEEEEMPDKWVLVAQGQFSGVDTFHQGSGSTAIFQQGNRRVLRFEDFSVTNGPDLHVILTRHPSPSKPSQVGDDYIDLGPLKGNLGNQNYEIRTDVELSAYQGVVIYCVPFHAVFATATLGL
jgi:hypothetical protein